MGKQTIRLQNNGVSQAFDITRNQVKKYITDDNPTGDIVKLKWAGFNFVIPFKQWRQIAHKSIFELYTMGELGKWKIELKR